MLGNDVMPSQDQKACKKALLGECKKNDRKPLLPSQTKEASCWRRMEVSIPTAVHRPRFSGPVPGPPGFILRIGTPDLSRTDACRVAIRQRTIFGPCAAALYIVWPWKQMVRMLNWKCKPAVQGRFEHGKSLFIAIMQCLNIIKTTRKTRGLH